MNLSTTLKLVTSTAIFSLISNFHVRSASADHLNFTLYNESSKSINYLYVSPARSSKWGSNILNKVVKSGDYTRITFPNQTSDSPCIYDIAAIFADRTKVEKRFNLCGSNNDVTIR